MLWGGQGGRPSRRKLSAAEHLNSGRPTVSEICSLAMQGAHAKERALDALKHVG